MNLPTAEEFWSEVISSEKEFSMLTELRKLGLHKHVFEAMRRFTKMHVEEALNQASRVELDDVELMPEANDFEEARELSIINAYPLENIK